jgi:N-glycosylase/DNA lyase
MNGEECILIDTHADYSIFDTFECGQAFRAEKIYESEDYIEYATVVKDKLLRFGQSKAGEVYVYGLDEDEFIKTAVPYMSFDRDYEMIRADIIAHTDSKWLKDACEMAKGIAILRQDPWEALISFIISQNNNIPRIKGIVRKISAQYGECIALRDNMKKCPFNKINCTPCEEICQNCGACYTFPTAKAILDEPEKLLYSKPGFRYKYMLDAAQKVMDGVIDFEKIRLQKSYDISVSELSKIKGVGEKVASCVALFALDNLDAFPIDVLIKRAIDTYFEGRLDPKSLGAYAGIAQQYIFHYIKSL